MIASTAAASATIALPAAASSPGTSHEPPRAASATALRWQLEDYFDTLEQAERAVKRLRRRGVDATLSLIGGLSVLAYR
jgi:hypothetical protein